MTAAPAKIRAMSPRASALAFRIWQHCQNSPDGWYQPIGGVAEAIGISTRRAASVAARMGWTNRFQSTTSGEYHNHCNLISMMDMALEDLW